MSDLFDLFEVPDLPEDSEAVAPDLLEALERLRREVDSLPRDFNREPRLFMLAVAVQDVLEAAGMPSTGADPWVQYEASGRRSSKLEEARSRANEFYFRELDAIKDGWHPVYKTEQSSLPWRQPTDQSRPRQPEPESSPEGSPSE